MEYELDVDPTPKVTVLAPAEVLKATWPLSVLALPKMACPPDVSTPKILLPARFCTWNAEVASSTNAVSLAHDSTKRPNMTR